ncbi:MAG: phosphate signaling complex protein PhoU [Gammaproteobacteria bacterium]
MTPTVKDHSHHISRQFNADLEEVKKHMLEMGGLVEKQIEDSINALFEADSGAGSKIIKQDSAIDTMEVQIDEECNLILARRQPAASDLRLVLAIIKTVRDLERIGDESVKIAKAAVKISEKGGFPEGLTEFRSLGKRVRKMVNMALDAFTRYDAATAVKIAMEDSEADDEYSIAMRTVVSSMRENSKQISRMLQLLWALRALERVGDHAKNICEHVIYLVEGTDVRHENLQDVASKIRSPGD